MEVQLFALADVQAFVICLVRIGALVAALPLFGSAQVPAQVRLGLAFLLALLVFPLVQSTLPAQDLPLVGLGILLVQEVLLGALVGLIARLVFTAVQMGGAVVGYQMGFAAANIFDPQTQSQNSLISQFQHTLALLVFLALDAHYLIIEAMVRSFQWLPPGQLNLGGEAIPFLMGLAGRMFSLGVQLSAPILAVLLISSFILGILARIFPQLNVLLLSFPINIGVAFLVIGLTLSLVATLLSREFGAWEEQLGQLFLYLG